MKEWTVSWAIEVDAETPEDAVHAAMGKFGRDGCRYFEVTPFVPNWETAETLIVDLDGPEWGGE